jgi:hypothetical protein
MSSRNINDGGVDGRSAAELAIAPAEPEKRSLPAVGKLKFGGLLGAVSKAKSLSSATFSAIKSGLAAKQELITLSTSLADSVKGFDAAKTALVAGKTFLKGGS